MIFSVILFITYLSALTFMGFLVISLLFPHESVYWKTAVGSGLEMALIGVIVLAFDLTKIRLELSSLIISSTILNGMLLIFGWVFQKHQELTFFSNHTFNFTGLLKKYLNTFVLTAIFILFLMGSFFIISQNRHGGYTEFYIKESVMNAPWRQEHDLPVRTPITFVVSHQEIESEAFSIKVEINGEIIDDIDLGILEPDQSAEISYQLYLKDKGANYCSFTLYKGKSTVPYRKLFFTVTIN